MASADAVRAAERAAPAPVDDDWYTIENSMSPKVMIFDEPTRGIDVGAKSEIYTIMQDLARQGVCVIVVSSELPEVLGVSDRIAVMRQGKIAAVLPRAEVNEATLLKLALPVETARAS